MAKAVQKIFVLDANVLMHNPQSIFSFQDNTVVFPITVLEELNHNKKRSDDVGRNTREAVRILDRLRAIGSLRKGVKMENGGTALVVWNYKKIDNDEFSDVDFTIPDNRILAVAYNLTQLEKNKSRGRKDVIMVTKDINMRLKADAMGILVEDYLTGKVNFDELYTGNREIIVERGVVERFHQDRLLSLPDKFFPNEFVHLIEEGRNPKKCIARYDAAAGFVSLDKRYETVFGLTSTSKEQRMAFDVLLNPEIDLVTLVGEAGTGKTLVALAAALQGVRITRYYENVLVSRPMVPMGPDIGYLPGSKDDKLNPWTGPIRDSVEYLISQRNGGGKRRSSDRGNGQSGHDKNLTETVQSYFDEGYIVVEALTYIQGRTITRKYYIIDEAQNLTPGEAKTIISRAGVGTKVVLVGDPRQINNPYVDSASNGLTYVVDRLKHRARTAHITLVNTVRSSLASIAAEDL